MLALVNILPNVRKNYLIHSTIFNDDYPTDSLNIDIYSWRRVFLEKPPVPQILNEYFVFYGTSVE